MLFTHSHLDVVKLKHNVAELAELNEFVKVMSDISESVYESYKKRNLRNASDVFKKHAGDASNVVKNMLDLMITLSSTMDLPSLSPPTFKDRWSSHCITAIDKKLKDATSTWCNDVDRFVEKCKDTIECMTDTGEYSSSVSYSESDSSESSENSDSASES